MELFIPLMKRKEEKFLVNGEFGLEMDYEMLCVAELLFWYHALM